ncbi:glycosyltransferase family 2 protein [Candidatus Latescibacterota bacterium]
MEKYPLVSIVIPCLNRARFLVPTIESILQQDYEYIECIVKDGGSTDGTIEILKSYGDRIRWISEPDDSHTDAINKGWWLSTGDILAWLNADDKYATPYTVSKAVEYMINNPHVDVLYGDYAFINEEGKVISEIAKPIEYDLVYAVKYCDHIIPQAASFMRRSILEKVNWLDPEFVNCKDHELWLRIAMVGKIKYAPFFGAYICQGDGLSQRSDVVEGKVNLTKKFFSQSNLPSPFNSIRFKKRSLSNAYMAGGIFVWYGSKQLNLFVPSLLNALKTDPWNCPSIVNKLSIHVFPHIIPQPVKKLLSFGRKCIGKSCSYSVSTQKLFIEILLILIASMALGLLIYIVGRHIGTFATLTIYMTVLAVSVSFLFFYGMRFLYRRKWKLYMFIRDLLIVATGGAAFGLVVVSVENRFGTVYTIYLSMFMLVSTIGLLFYKTLRFINRMKKQRRKRYLVL